MQNDDRKKEIKAIIDKLYLEAELVSACVLPREKFETEKTRLEAILFYLIDMNCINQNQDGQPIS